MKNLIKLIFIVFNFTINMHIESLTCSNIISYAYGEFNLSKTEKLIIERHDVTQDKPEIKYIATAPLDHNVHHYIFKDPKYIYIFDEEKMDFFPVEQCEDVHKDSLPSVVNLFIPSYSHKDNLVPITVNHLFPNQPHNPVKRFILFNQSEAIVSCFEDAINPNNKCEIHVDSNKNLLTFIIKSDIDECKIILKPDDYNLNLFNTISIESTNKKNNTSFCKYIDKYDVLYNPTVHTFGFNVQFLNNPYYQKGMLYISYDTEFHNIFINTETTNLKILRIIENMSQHTIEISYKKYTKILQLFDDFICVTKGCVNLTNKVLYTIAQIYPDVLKSTVIAFLKFSDVHYHKVLFIKTDHGVQVIHSAELSETKGIKPYDVHQFLHEDNPIILGIIFININIEDYIDPNYIVLNHLGQLRDPFFYKKPFIDQ